MDSEKSKSDIVTLLEHTRGLRRELEEFLGIPYSEPTAGMEVIAEDLQAAPGSPTKLAAGYRAQFAGRARRTMEAFVARGIEPADGYDAELFVRPVDGGDIFLVWALLVWMETQLEGLGWAICERPMRLVLDGVAGTATEPVRATSWKTETWESRIDAR
jgi:hypothetical protein